MIEIDINDTQTLIELNLERLHAVAVETLQEEGVESAEVSIAIIDGDTMQRLNREHLGHDYDTDVLSFLFESTPQTSQVANGLPPRNASIEGEVLIGADTALRVAGGFGWSVESEVMLYLVHGLLHLVGYDDLTDVEKTMMRQREKFHLARWGLTPVYADVAIEERSSDCHDLDSSESPLGVRG